MKDLAPITDSGRELACAECGGRTFHIGSYASAGTIFTCLACGVEHHETALVLTDPVTRPIECLSAGPEGFGPAAAHPGWRPRCAKPAGHDGEHECEMKWLTW